MPFVNAAMGGVAAIQAAQVNVNGYPVGMQSTALVNGVGAGFRVLRFAKRFGGKGQAPQVQMAAGDNNRNRLPFLYPAEQLGQVQLMFDSLDLQALASMQGILMASPVSGNANIVLLQSNAPVNAIQTAFIVNVDASDADSGAFGRKKFWNEIYPLVNIASLGPDLANATKAEWEYQGIPAQADKFPWGEAFTVATYGATRAVAAILTSDYPITIDTFLGDGTTTTYTLANTPAGTQGAVPCYLLAWTNGVALATTVFSVVLATRVVTFTVAPVAGSVTVLRYESTDLLANN